MRTVGSVVIPTGTIIVAAKVVSVRMVHTTHDHYLKEQPQVEAKLVFYYKITSMR
jgi:hypothetical protein